MDTTEILEKLAAGQLGVAEAEQRLKAGGVVNLGFARLDTDRPRRCGAPEFIYCEGKTADQVVSIIGAFKESGQNVLATRAAAEVFEAVKEAHPDAAYHEIPRIITVEVTEPETRSGGVAVVAAGTSDLPVAEEAALVAEHMGANVHRLTDVGVAGLHRLTPHLDTIRSCRIAIVVAGMEGALPSVVGGLVDIPLIAVPTSVGYGMNLDGLAAFLAMLNSCVPGITVVNVDNGVGAGVAAALINRVR